ncbi:hypothetical protein LV82_02282 [Albidovulum inexpectatum]|uniref:DUF6314 domain-containing protein n=1 Tax=Albidovulum inexpectatum TaxID=196587 RepID=A0A2S5JF16_9RHOB|nr:DUF6314 family protein [Albidovulum inexpectatum]PPB80000.1 hypothetical protein LV82_02282 [Albidovulum inexpectatum]
MDLQLSDLEGIWLIQRKIDDRRAGHVLHFAGQAQFRPDGIGLHYFETGQLHLPDGTKLRAERSYLWRRQAGRIVVLFPDGRSFHDFTPDRAEACHLCAADEYRVRYDFSGWPEWRAEWAVRGPAKDYAMVSHYRRPGDA